VETGDRSFLDCTSCFDRQPTVSEMETNRRRSRTGQGHGILVGLDRGPICGPGGIAVFGRFSKDIRTGARKMHKAGECLRQRLLSYVVPRTKFKNLGSFVWDFSIASRYAGVWEWERSRARPQPGKHARPRPHGRSPGIGPSIIGMADMGREESRFRNRVRRGEPIPADRAASPSLWNRK